MKQVVGRMWTALLLVLVLNTPVVAQARTIHVLAIDGAISSATADYVKRGVGLAERQGSEAVIIQLNTPGGDVNATLRIMETLENAEVPVIVHVWPRGGMAASAGTLVTLAASGAAMAPNTTIGAAHPVTVGGTDVETEAEKKLVNVLVEHTSALASRRGEEVVEWAERAIRESEAASAESALEIGLIDVIAEDLDDLLAEFDGRLVRLGPDEVKLHTADTTVREVPMSWVEQVLSVLINPNIAFLLLVLGVQFVLLELSAPGGWVAGFLGAVCLALAAYALSVLPLNWLGLVLMLAAFALFFIDLQTPGVEAVTLVATATLIAGALILFNVPGRSPFGRISVPLVVATALAIGAFFAFIVAKGLRAQKLRPVTGMDTLIGRQGKVRTALDPAGTVQVAGELWTATADDGPIEEGEPVEVTAVEGVRLRVKRAAQDER
ncbi:MAG: nodulation protein NfeD [Anaerolineae bacterium]|jgi:membrane-bound serine protease (ClpP class)